LSRIFCSKSINLLNDWKNTITLSPLTNNHHSTINAVVIISECTCYLKIRETFPLGFPQQRNIFTLFRKRRDFFGRLRRNQTIFNLQFMQFQIRLHYTIKLLKEPSVNASQFMNLINCISSPKCFRNNEYTTISRFSKCLIYIWNHQFFVFDKAMHSLANHTKTFL